MSNQSKGWIGVDLDGTLAQYDGWKGIEHIGDPVPKMLERVKAWISDGRDVRILTARVAPVTDDRDLNQTVFIIQKWCVKHVGCTIPITCAKDHGLVELWDDRAVQVIPNTGERADGKE